MAAAVAVGALCACAPTWGENATPYPNLAAPLATAPAGGENATSYPDIAAPLGTTPAGGENATSYPDIAAPLGTAPPAATSTPTHAPVATPIAAPLSYDAEMLDEGTSEILSCMGEGGQACEDVVLLLDEWGGVIPTIGETPAVRADGVSAHGLARQMFDAATPAQVSALAPQFLGAINQLRAALGLPALAG
jgi:hypothetical protein